MARTIRRIRLALVSILFFEVQRIGWRRDDEIHFARGKRPKQLQRIAQIGGAMFGLQVGLILEKGSGIVCWTFLPLALARRC